MSWILLVLLSGDTGALTNVPGFKSKDDCEAAAKVAKEITSWSMKSVRTACLPQPVPTK